jgi:hypothetical protein
MRLSNGHVENVYHMLPSGNVSGQKSSRDVLKVSGAATTHRHISNESQQTTHGSRTKACDSGGRRSTKGVKCDREELQVQQVAVDLRVGSIGPGRFEMDCGWKLVPQVAR